MTEPTFNQSYFLAATDADRAAEALWLGALAPGQLDRTGNEILIPYSVLSVIGGENVDKLALRLS